MTEKWAQILGFEGFYEVSDQGALRSVERYVERPRFGKIERESVEKINTCKTES